MLKLDLTRLSDFVGISQIFFAKTTERPCAARCPLTEYTDFFLVLFLSFLEYTDHPENAAKKLIPKSGEIAKQFTGVRFGLDN